MSIHLYMQGTESLLTRDPGSSASYLPSVSSLPETFVVNIATTTRRNEFVIFVLDPYGT